MRKGAVALSCALAFGPGRLLAQTRPSPDLPTVPRATLRLNVYPGSSHVYLDDIAGTKLSLLCTGWCTLHPQAGTYRLRAGLTHAYLGEAPNAITLAPASERTLRVDVERRDGYEWATLALLGTGLLTMLTAVTVRFATYGLDEKPAAGSPAMIVLYCGVGLTLGGIGIGLVAPKTPNVYVRSL
jgi:hypothetical protein